MQLSLLVCKSALHDLFERFHEAKLNRDLGSHSDQREKHAFVERHQAFLRDGFAESVEVALVVFLRFGDDLDLDIFEREHADHLSPAGHAAAEEVFCHLEGSGHV